MFGFISKIIVFLHVKNVVELKQGEHIEENTLKNWLRLNEKASQIMRQHLTQRYTKVQVLSLAQLSNFLSFKICTTCAVSCRDEWPVHVQLHSWLPGGLQVPHPPRIRWVEFYTNTAVKEIPGAILLLNGKLWEFIIYICSSFPGFKLCGSKVVESRAKIRECRLLTAGRYRYLYLNELVH